MSEGAEKFRRHSRGFEPASGLLKDRIRTAGEARGFAVARLLTHWAEVVGADIAAIALPVKIGYGRPKSGKKDDQRDVPLGATLTLLTTGSHAPLLQMQTPKIREKVNACYGYNAITNIVVTQTAPSGFAEGQVAFTPAPKAASAPTDPALRQKASDTADGVRDPALRAALEALGEKVLSRPRQTKG